MSGVTKSSLLGAAQRTDPLSVASASRIAAMGRLQADDSFLHSSNPTYQEWLKAQPKLYLTPEKSSLLICHTANLTFELGRRVNADEIRWTLGARFGGIIERSQVNHLLNYCIHEEADRMAREWMGRLPGRRKLPDWVTRLIDDGVDVPIIKADVSLCATLNGSTIQATGNAEVDAVFASIYEDMDAKLPFLPSSARKSYEKRTAQVAFAASETRTERVMSENRITSLEQNVSELMRLAKKRND